MRRIKTRYAPTPSGYLHLGNAWSFVLTWLLARGGKGGIHLRIDDLDTARLRPEYLEDIFASLDWLGLDWDTGPRDPEDFRARFSQRLRLDAYRAALDALAAGGGPEGPAVYACACSREQVKRAARSAGAPGTYPGTCRSLALDLAAPGAAWRLRLDPEEEVPIRDIVTGTLWTFPGREAGDFVIRQRNGDPAYQLASVVDDEALGVNLVVRGQDLLPSTAMQLALARRLGARGFAEADFLHHGLVVEGTIPAQEGGEAAPAKLSKSAGGMQPGEQGPMAASLRAIRERQGSPDTLYAFFARLLGMDPAGKSSAGDLLPGFARERIPSGPIRWEDFPAT